MSNKKVRSQASDTPFWCLGRHPWLWLLLFFCWLSASTVWAQQPPQNRILVTIPNMHCESCAKKIRSRLFTLPGVAKVSTTLSKNLAEIEPGPGKTVSVYEVWDALEKAKFEPSKIVSPEGEFSEKPQKRG